MPSAGFAADSGGYEQLITWALGLGAKLTFAIEGTGSCGAGLTFAVRRRGVDSPCRYSNGSTSAIFGDLRAHADKLAEENRHRSPVCSSVRLSLTRGTRTVTAPAAVITIRSLCEPFRTTNLRPSASRRGLDRRRPGLQRRGEHRSRAFQDKLIEQRSTVLWRSRHSSSCATGVAVAQLSGRRLVPGPFSGLEDLQRAQIPHRRGPLGESWG